MKGGRLHRASLGYLWARRPKTRETCFEEKRPPTGRAKDKLRLKVASPPERPGRWRSRQGYSEPDSVACVSSGQVGTKFEGRSNSSSDRPLVLVYPPTWL